MALVPVDSSQDTTLILQRTMDFATSKNSEQVCVRCMAFFTKLSNVIIFDAIQSSFNFS